MTATPPICDPASVAAVLGYTDVPDTCVDAAATADAVVRHWYGSTWPTVEAMLTAVDTDPVTAGDADVARAAAVRSAATAVGVDVHRRPTTPGGYFQVADYVGRLSLDPAHPVSVQLGTAGRSWGMA